jgi:carotenoid cleavage dioxygenase-like enzyme
LFELPPLHYAQEPSFVPRSQPRAEDDGFLLTSSESAISVAEEEDFEPPRGVWLERTSAIVRWSTGVELPPLHYAQEPSFVPRSQPRAEDDGFLLTYVFGYAYLAAAALRGRRPCACPRHR